MARSPAAPTPNLPHGRSLRIPILPPTPASPSMKWEDQASLWSPSSDSRLLMVPSELFPPPREPSQPLLTRSSGVQKQMRDTCFPE